MFSRTAIRFFQKSTTPFPEVERALTELQTGRDSLSSLPIAERLALLNRCEDDTYAAAKDWVQTSCEGKEISFNSPLAGEEWMAGPWSVMRFIRLLSETLERIERAGEPRPPGKVRRGPQGQAIVPVFPTGTIDRLLFRGIKGSVWMQPGVTPKNYRETLAPHFRPGRSTPGISLVLGAGNVSSISPTDALTRIFISGKVVLLKMHPVNAYLEPVFKQAFGSLIEAGLLRIVFGGADVGAYAAAHEAVDDVHLTGSSKTYDTILWGKTEEEQASRKAENDPLLKKPITSELGNVSPVIVAPAKFSERELRFQAENVVSMVTNNASFNCNSAKMVITWKDWPQRQDFLNAIVEKFSDAPLRTAYYPGAHDRYERFTGQHPVSYIGFPESEQLSWTLIRNVPPDRDSLYFQEEAFCGVLAETALEAASPAEFLTSAATFANDSMWGTLNACLIVPRAFRRSRKNRKALRQAVADLRYGTIGINIWPAVSFATMSAPWGGWQGEGITKENPHSGLGWMHNTYLLENAQKTVFESPSVTFPKPAWFSSHKTSHFLGPKLVAMEHRPSLAKLPGIIFTALKG